LAKTLNKLFQGYTGQTKTAIKGGHDLIEMIKGGRFHNKFLASCDAVALYPSILVEEALKRYYNKRFKKTRTLNKEQT
jgi:hypothetical protein